MKSRALALNLSRANILLVALSALGVVSLLVFWAALVARADVGPTVDTTIYNSANAAVNSAPIGSSVYDTAMVSTTSASTTPTGTVDFNLYNNTSCSGSPTTQAGVALVGGAATSSTTTVPSGGLSYKVHYNGDATSTPADSQCEPLTATSANSSITTALSTTTALAGTSVHDSATLNNTTADATGTVAYVVYNDNACSTGAFSAGVKTVASSVVPDSNSVPFNNPGTYWWQAAYSGDQHNTAATSTCQSEVLTINATSTPPATTTPGTISGTVYNDANSNDTFDAGDTGLAGFTVWLHQGTQNYDSPIIATAVTDGGGHYSFGSLAFGTYFLEEQEQKQAGWNQTSDDLAVVLGTSSPSGTVDFANVAKGTGGNGGKGNQHCDGDGDADDVGCTTATSTPNKGHGWFGQWLNDVKSRFQNGHDHGNHYGWLKNGNNGNNGNHYGNNKSKGKDDD